MKWLYGITIAIDIVFLFFLLTMPRSGMEAMGTGFILIPLMFIRLVVSLVGIVTAWRLTRWGFVAYALLGMGVMAGGWFYGLQLSPRDQPLYRALWQKVRHQGKNLADFTDRKVYDAKQAVQKLEDADQAAFCKNLTDETDLARLKTIIANHKEMSGTCVTRENGRVGPILHVIMDQYGPFPEGARDSRDVDWFRVRDVTELLLDHGADPNLRDSRGNTPLHYAVRFDNEALTKVLLAGGACVFLENDSGESPLALSEYSGFKRLLRRASQDPAMIAKCPDILGKKPGKPTAKRTPDAPQHQQSRLDPALVSALRGADVAETAELLRKGVDPHGTDGKGGALHVAMYNCYDGVTAVLKLLLDAGLDINARNIRGQTPLVMAVDKCSRAVSLLLDQGADPTIGDRQGATAIHYLVGSPPKSAIPIMEKLLAAGLDINQKDKLGRTPLITIGYMRNGYEAARMLLDHGADPNAQDAHGNTLLHLLADATTVADATQTIALLLENGADVNLRNQNKITPLVSAVKRGKPAVVESLLNAGTEVNVTDESKHPLVMSAIFCRPEKLEILNLLTAAGADVRTTDQYIGNPPLAKAVSVNVACPAAAEILLNAGVDPNARDRNGGAPVHQLSYWTKKPIDPTLELLLTHGARIDIRNQQEMTALLLTARGGTQVDVMKSLLKNGADPTLVDRDGNSLLHCVAMNRNAGASEMLNLALSIGGNPAAVNQKGQTPLDLARKYRNTPMIEALSELKK